MHLVGHEVVRGTIMAWPFYGSFVQVFAVGERIEFISFDL